MSPFNSAALIIVSAIVPGSGVKRQRLFTAALGGLSKNCAFGLQALLAGTMTKALRHNGP
jgi:hypothetical protein